MLFIKSSCVFLKKRLTDQLTEPPLPALRTILHKQSQAWLKVVQKGNDCQGQRHLKWFYNINESQVRSKGEEGGGSNTTPSCSDMKINNTLLRFCCTVQTRSTVIKPREEDIKDHKPQAVSVPRWCNTDLLQGSKVCWLASTHSPPVRTRPTRPDSS